jgi:hypothetical protein
MDLGKGMKGKGMGKSDCAAEHSSAGVVAVPVFVWFVWFAVDPREKLKLGKRKLEIRGRSSEVSGWRRGETSNIQRPTPNIEQGKPEPDSFAEHSFVWLVAVSVFA